jgi:hypothetical protein
MNERVNGASLFSRKSSASACVCVSFEGINRGEEEVGFLFTHKK